MLKYVRTYVHTKIGVPTMYTYEDVTYASTTYYLPHSRKWLQKLSVVSSDVAFLFETWYRNASTDTISTVNMHVLQNW